MDKLISPLTVTIGSQEWMLKNLDVSTYNNGDLIQYVSDPHAWAALTTGAWCWYENDASNGEKYGKLYNWYAAIDERGLVPAGYHIPSVEEWIILIPTTWTEPIETDATNLSRFTTLLGGGQRDGDSKFYWGKNGVWWTTTKLQNEHNYTFRMYDDMSSDFDFRVNNAGCSIRCLKD